MSDVLPLLKQGGMSIKEVSITELIKRHPDVKRDIEVLAEQLEVDVLTFQRIYLDSMNRKQTEYLLDNESGLPHLAHAVCCLIFLM